MKIDIDINKEYKNISIIIKAPKMDSNVTEIVNRLNLEEKKKQGPISGKLDDKIYVLSPHEVILFYSQNGKVLAQTKDKTLEVKQPLYSLEEQLVNTTFIRISQSAIVNVRKIKNVEVAFNGSLVVKCVNGHSEIISRRYVAKFKQFIGIGGKK